MGPVDGIFQRITRQKLCQPQRIVTQRPQSSEILLGEHLWREVRGYAGASIQSDSPGRCSWVRILWASRKIIARLVRPLAEVPFVAERRRKLPWLLCRRYQ
jgi:hypothetical protein